MSKVNRVGIVYMDIPTKKPQSQYQELDSPADAGDCIAVLSASSDP